MSAIAERFAIDRRLLVGGDGIELEEFLASPAEHFLARPALVTPAVALPRLPLRLAVDFPPRGPVR